MKYSPALLVVVVSVVTVSLCQDDGPDVTDRDGLFSSPLAAQTNGRLTMDRRRTNRDTDSGGGDDFRDEYFGKTDRNDFNSRTVYHHVSDGASSSSSSSDDGWIIGGSRRRASAGTHKQHGDKTTLPDGDKWREPDDPKTWPVGPDAASSLSEVQVVVHQSPHRRNEQQQQHSDASSKWYSKRLSYVTKTTSPAPTSAAPHQQPVAAGSNAVLLTEVLGHKSGFNTSAGYYGSAAPVTNTGSKGFQNDLMDMLGKSTWRLRFLSIILFLRRCICVRVEKAPSFLNLIFALKTLAETDSS